MFYSLASLALFSASAAAMSVGSAHVVNKCPYEIYLDNVPAAGGGYEESDTVLASGGSWSQVWTQLTNGNGWSIKLSQTPNLSNILQYEYTYTGDNMLWYDLSEVNGNPWNGDWMITSDSDDCNPNQQAYRYATDDAYGEQSCTKDASITVTLCSSMDDSTPDKSTPDNSTPDDSTPDNSVLNIVPSLNFSPAEPPSPTSTAAAETKAKLAFNWNNVDASKSAADSAPTTFATLTTAAVESVVTDAPKAVAFGVEGMGNTVFEIETEVVTAYVTALAPLAKRHQHHAHQHHA